MYEFLTSLIRGKKATEEKNISPEKQAEIAYTRELMTKYFGDEHRAATVLGTEFVANLTPNASAKSSFRLKI